MSDIVIVALVSLAGTLAGTFGGIVVSSRLTTYRIQQLEKKQDKHNSLIERVYCVEGKLGLVDEKICDTNRRIDELVHNEQ